MLDLKEKKLLQYYKTGQHRHQSLEVSTGFSLKMNMNVFTPVHPVTTAGLCASLKEV